MPEGMASFDEFYWLGPSSIHAGRIFHGNTFSNKCIDPTFVRKDVDRNIIKGVYPKDAYY